MTDTPVAPTNTPINYKKIVLYIASILVIFALGYGTAKYQQPKTEIENIDKVIATQAVVKQEAAITTNTAIVKTQEIVKNDRKVAHTHTLTIKKPDGTIITKKTVDFTDTKNYKQEAKQEASEQKIVKLTLDETVDSASTEHKTDIVKNDPPNWMVGVYVGTNFKSLSSVTELNVGVQVSRRIIGPVFIGASADKQLNFSVSATILF